jgi:hypothetical protein
MAVTIDEVDVEIAERPAPRQTPGPSAPAPARTDPISLFRRLAERQDRLKAD